MNLLSTDHNISVETNLFDVFDLILNNSESQGLLYCLERTMFDYNETFLSSRLQPRHTDFINLRIRYNLMQFLKPVLDTSDISIYNDDCEAGR